MVSLCKLGIKQDECVRTWAVWSILLVDVSHISLCPKLPAQCLSPAPCSVGICVSSFSSQVLNTTLRSKRSRRASHLKYQTARCGFISITFFTHSTLVNKIWHTETPNSKLELPTWHKRRKSSQISTTTLRSSTLQACKSAFWLFNGSTRDARETNIYILGRLNAHKCVRVKQNFCLLLKRVCVELTVALHRDNALPCTVVIRMSTASACRSSSGRRKKTIHVIREHVTELKNSPPWT